MPATVQDFLAAGYFPKELPPSFSTVSYASAVRNGTPPTGDHPRVARMCSHYFGRPGSLRRKLGIPNPVHFRLLAETLANEWPTISSHIDKSLISASRPTASAVVRSVVPKLMWNTMISARMTNSAKASNILKADINQFYGSLYTHSIPWALHTKEVAKNNRKSSLLGNLIDEQVRNMQDGQTVGIPIGPDTSLVIAEILLSAIDVKLQNSDLATSACRLIDDFEFGVTDISSGDSLLADLQHQLSEYELVLNPKKTKLLQAPRPFASEWIHELRRFRFRTSRNNQKYDLLAYYDSVLRLARAFPEASVVKYGMSRLRPVRIHPDNWPMHQLFLRQAIVAEPGVFPETISQMIRFQAAGNPVDTGELGDIIGQHIVKHAKQGHGNDVAWALWTALAFRVPLPETVQASALKMDDSVVALLLLDAESQNLLANSIKRSRWSSAMTKNGLYRDQWLLSYEARHKRWRNSKGGGSHIEKDVQFGWMHDNDVSFYTPVSQPVSPPVIAVAALMEQEAFGFSSG